jgi:hypothetical protein
MNGCDRTRVPYSFTTTDEFEKWDVKILNKIEIG